METNIRIIKYDENLVICGHIAIKNAMLSKGHSKCGEKKNITLFCAICKKNFYLSIMLD